MIKQSPKTRAERGFGRNQYLPAPFTREAPFRAFDLAQPLTTFPDADANGNQNEDESGEGDGEGNHDSWVSPSQRVKAPARLGPAPGVLDGIGPVA